MNCSSFAPQTETPLTSGEVDTLRGDLQNLVNNKDCGNLVTAVLAELRRLTGRSYYNTNSAMSLFNTVVSQAGFHRVAADASVAGAWGGGGPNNAKITINSNALYFSDLTDTQHTFQRGLTTIHELMHVAGYGHLEMARAARNVALAQSYSNVGALPSRRNFAAGKKGAAAFDVANAQYFNGLRNQACLGGGR